MRFLEDLTRITLIDTNINFTLNISRIIIWFIRFY